jgi:hypothetical protein
MNLNAKMIPIETVPGNRGWRIKDKGWGGMIYLIHLKPYKCYSVPPPSTTIKEKK